MERGLLFVALLCLVGLALVLMLWDNRPPRCRVCRRRHRDNPPGHIGGYQPCPPEHPHVPANLPPRHP